MRKIFRNNDSNGFEIIHRNGPFLPGLKAQGMLGRFGENTFFWWML